MVMPVAPGWAYFGFYSDFGDVSRGAAVSYATAVASAAADGARDVADMTPADIGDPPISPTHPKIFTFTGGATSMAINMSYDNGYFGDAPPGTEFVPSNFLVELQGPGALDFQVDIDGPYNIFHYVSSDGGQSIYMNSTEDLLLTGVTRIKIWRVSVFPGDPLPNPEYFWTSHVGTREIP